MVYVLLNAFHNCEALLSFNIYTKTRDLWNWSNSDKMKSCCRLFPHFASKRTWGKAFRRMRTINFIHWIIGANMRIIKHVYGHLKLFWNMPPLIAIHLSRSMKWTFLVRIEFEFLFLMAINYFYIFFVHHKILWNVF